MHAEQERQSVFWDLTTATLASLALLGVAGCDQPTMQEKSRGASSSTQLR